MPAQTLRIVKVNGTGNDFALLDERPQRWERYADLARTLCDRSGPIGADGLLVLLAPEKSAASRVVARMRIFNADGSEPEQCGNGVRCVARYLWDHDATSREFAVETASGPVGVSVEPGAEFVIRAEMPEVAIVRRYAEGASIEAAGTMWRYAEVSVGNPHVVSFVDDAASVDLETVGAAISGDPRFTGGTNVHVVQVAPASDGANATLHVRHYERGVGQTRACGTGAVAAAVAAIDDRRMSSPVTVYVPGGRLDVEWRPGERPLLSGGAEIEFERTLAL